MNTGNCFLWKLYLSTAFLRSWIVITFLLTALGGFSQTTNINGIVNSYHAVIGVGTNAVKLDNVSGLSYGNTVLIIQMKGATINTSNSASFGDISAMNSVGNYELAIICSVSSDSVYFFNNVLNSYDISNKVQLVKFGEYYSANVTGTVKAQSWNNATGKGGVLAIKVDQDLTLNAPLFADSTGYKGGAFYLHSGLCNFFNPVGNGYAYDATSAAATNGAYKGEGVADVPANLDGARGAPANGGGGGNNHNNGGGGGANLTAGGNGGSNFSTGPSNCIGSYAGRGGKALSNNSGTKIFPGGGGGAGHANSTVQAYAGGNGGGIIIVIANNIIGNGHEISANGQDGSSTSYDGASGGGAGGTIIMNVTNYTGALKIQAVGGKGGNEDDDNSSGRCYGAGGGGSGGAIYFNGTTPSVTIYDTAGIAGINIDAVSCSTPAPAVAGTNGLRFENYSYQASVTPSTSCTVALPLRIIYFNAVLSADKKIKLECDIDDPGEANSLTIEKLNSFNNWITISTITSNISVHHYEVYDENPYIGENIYRLRVNPKNGNPFYSIQKRVIVKGANSFIIYPNPAKDRLTIQGKLDRGVLIKLIDINGKVIKQIITNASLNSFEFPLPLLSPGIYILNVDNYAEKIMILH